MNLNWKDAGSTVLVAGIVTLAIAAVREWAPFLTVRWALAGMLILGIGACAVGGYSTANLPAAYSITMGALVAAMAVVAILGFIFGNKAYAVGLAALIGILWLIATTRHLVTN